MTELPEFEQMSNTFVPPETTYVERMSRKYRLIQETSNIVHSCPGPAIVPISKRKRRSGYPPEVRGMCRSNWSFDSKLQQEEIVELTSPLEVLFFSKWSNGTAAIMGDRPLSRHLVHYWEITLVDRVFGTSMQVGVATRDATLHWDRFRSLLGMDEHSWGFSHRGFIQHDAVSRQVCQPCFENLTVTIGVLFDGPRGKLSFYKDSVHLPGFTGFNEISADLYPACASTAARTTMRVTAQWRSYDNLQDRCRVALRKGFPCLEDLNDLSIPPGLRDYIRNCYDSPGTPVETKEEDAEVLTDKAAVLRQEILWGLGRNRNDALPLLRSDC